MGFARIARMGCAAALAVVCGWGLAGCMAMRSSTDDPLLDVDDLSGGVAATVNGAAIGENVITEYIESFRSAQGLEREEAWGEWLYGNGYTAETMRKDTIDYYASQELLRQAADQNGVSADKMQVMQKMQELRSGFDSDEEWNEALEQNGTTEDQQMFFAELSVLQEGLADKLFADEAVDDEQVLSFVRMYVSSCEGSKRSSHILFEAGEREKAQEVLDEINAGRISFEEAALSNSTDEASARKGGDVGWDKLSMFASAYQDALDGLEVGQVSGLVKSDYGIHIIKCTDELADVPDEVASLADVPEGFVESVREMADSQAKAQAFSAWMQDFQRGADIVVNDMPEGLPYDIDPSAGEAAAAE